MLLNYAVLLIKHPLGGRLHDYSGIVTWTLLVSAKIKCARQMSDETESLVLKLCLY